jgi:hypothetical protein
VKPATEWVHQNCGLNLILVEKIQADALRHAANIVMADWAIGGSDSAVRGSVKSIRKIASELSRTNE